MKSTMELNSDAVSIRRKLGEDSFSPVDIFALKSNIENTTLVYYPKGIYFKFK